MKEDLEILRGCSLQVSDESKPCNPHSCNKLNVYNYLADLPENENTPDIVEVRFKNTRKDFYQNVNGIKLTEGDMVAVEASPGHDIGTVSLTGELVREQMRRKRVFMNSTFKKIYRKVKETDVEKWQQAIDREMSVMLRSRQIARRLELEMKIGDVEFQGDGSKAIFYYIADGRVDFRQLIKVLAEEFKIRVEMRQIGARQEAGRIGGIGSCGRELCCASWMSNFVSVGTDTAREQEISLNPQKLAGQCGKLKCCLNFEQATYQDAKKEFPRKINLETEEGTAYFMKLDVHKKTMWYSFDAHAPKNVTAVETDRVHEIIAMNKKGEKPDKLALPVVNEVVPLSYSSDLGSQGSITRFDNGNERRSTKKRNNRKKSNTNKPNPRAKINSNRKTETTDNQPTQNTKEKPVQTSENETKNPASKPKPRNRPNRRPNPRTQGDEKKKFTKPNPNKSAANVTAHKTADNEKKDNNNNNRPPGKKNKNRRPPNRPNNPNRNKPDTNENKPKTD